MPFLRFSKDRRGYESTFLLDAHRPGDRDAPTLLYWFRTPPHVKMGRAALDEETIRVLEDTHPALDFDWPRILAARPQPTEPPPDPNRPPRGRRRGDRGDERGAPRPPKATLPVRAESPAAAASPRAVERPREIEAGFKVESEREREENVPDEARPGMAPQPIAVPELNMEPDEPEAPVRRFTRIYDAASDEPGGSDALAATAAPAGRLSEPSAADRALGGEQLERLRGRYAAVLARIARRVTDPALAERLRALAERANPDVWLTDDEVKAGLAGLNDVYAELVPFIGRRRRRRRSGHRNSADITGPISAASPTAPGSPETASPDEMDEDAGDADGDESDDDGSPESGE